MGCGGSYIEGASQPLGRPARGAAAAHSSAPSAASALSESGAHDLGTAGEALQLTPVSDESGSSSWTAVSLSAVPTAR